MYRYYTHDREQVLKMFLDFWKEQKVPDLSAWDDCTHEMPWYLEDESS